MSLIENGNVRLEPVDGVVQPPVIPEDKPGRTTNQLAFLYNPVLKAVYNHRYAWPFHHPVDSIKQNLPVSIF